MTSDGVSICAQGKYFLGLVKTVTTLMSVKLIRLKFVSSPGLLPAGQHPWDAPPRY